MKAHVYIDFACNDPDNGLFAGRVFQAAYGDAEIGGDFMNGYRFRVEDGAVKLHRRKFKFISESEWVGNWCWNRYKFRRSEAKRLLQTMRASGLWRCECGPTRFYEWFNRT